MKHASNTHKMLQYFLGESNDTTSNFWGKNPIEQWQQRCHRAFWKPSQSILSIQLECFLKKHYTFLGCIESFASFCWRRYRNRRVRSSQWKRRPLRYPHTCSVLIFFLSQCAATQLVLKTLSRKVNPRRLLTIHHISPGSYTLFWRFFKFTAHFSSLGGRVLMAAKVNKINRINF